MTLLWRRSTQALVCSMQTHLSLAKPHLISQTIFQCLIPLSSTTPAKHKLRMHGNGANTATVCACSVVKKYHKNTFKRLNNIAEWAAPVQRLNEAWNVNRYGNPKGEIQCSTRAHDTRICVVVIQTAHFQPVNFGSGKSAHYKAHNQSETKE